MLPQLPSGSALGSEDHTQGLPRWIAPPPRTEAACNDLHAVA